LTDEELRTLAAGMSHVIYAHGEVITRQGAAAHWLYVMTSGTAEIRAHVDPDGPHKGDPPRKEIPILAALRTGIDQSGSGPGGVPEQKVRVAELSAPDFFGEMSLMTGEPRSADVIAIGDVDCFRLGRDTFKTVLLGRPEIAEELSSKLASRRVELLAARGGLDAAMRSEREASERARILRGIKAFFALDAR
jgi:CRP-like cAMP-binding protein